ncbi:MAG: hypothetical protein ACTSQQ_01220 [Candidatus Helarchaeota archaeon]
MSALKEIRKVAQRIKDENIKGANYIFLTVLSSLKEYVEQFEDQRLIETIRESCEILFQAQPSMALLANSLALILQSVDFISKEYESPASIKQELLSKITHLINSYQNQLMLIPQNASQIIPKKGNILVYSFSSTVLETIKYQKTLGNDLNIYITESRPNNEGLLGAKEFSQLYPTTLFIDAGIGYIFQQYPIDLILLGADSFSENELIHKIGTLPLAITANAFDIPVYVLAHSLKYYYGTFFNFPVPIELKPPSEITSIKCKNLLIRNYYFDRTPMNYVEGVLTEKGLLRSKTDFKKIVQNFPIDIIGQLYRNAGKYNG